MAVAPAVPATGPRVDACLVDDFRARLVASGTDLTDAERVDLIRALEELKSCAAAGQAHHTAAFDASQRAAQAASGAPARDRGKGIAAQVALARHESATRGEQHVGLARVLVAEMPHTLEALGAGLLTEWRATLLVRETACLSLEHRIEVDRWVGEQIDRLCRLGDKRLVAEARKLTYRLDPASVVRRARRQENERTVTCRPAPDTMAYLTALLPAKQAVAAYAALTKAADSDRAAGDPRTRGQAMADTLVERVTGQREADATPAEVQVVITDRALLRGDDEPAYLSGYGVVPAGLVREWVTAKCADDPSNAAQVWLRRLYTHPRSGQLIAMDSHRRRFRAGLRDYLVVRDQLCRFPWCDAPIRHADHSQRHHDGGPTSAVNGQGLCERHNHAKDAPGWRSRPGAHADRPGRHTIEITTPTGHCYDSTAPPLPGPRHPLVIEVYRTDTCLDLAG